jgi:glycosyltransferase involved in cell wall biosynthesis
VKVLHVVREKGGGIGRYLSVLEKLGEEIWEVSSMGLPPSGYDVLVVHGVIPEVVGIGVSKAYYFHGLRSISRRLILGLPEINPLNLFKLVRFRRYLKNFDLFLFPTDSMRRKATEIYGVDGVVLPLPFPGEIPKGTVIPYGRTLLWVGRDAWIKGYDTLLEMASALDDWKFVAVGVDKGGPPNVDARGYVDRETLERLYVEATFLLITSYYESFSYAALESMAAGTPVLVLERAGGAAEMVKRVGLGRTFADVDALISYLRAYRGESFTSKGGWKLLSPHSHLKRLRTILNENLNV